MQRIQNALLLATCLALTACTAAPSPTATAVVNTATPLAPTVDATVAVAPAASRAPSATSLPARTLAAGQWTTLFYHPVLEQVVLVNGGPDRGKPLDDPLELWGWDGAQWTLLSADPAGPHWRNFATAAYDTARNVLVLHGGVQTQSAWLADTWEWDGHTWVDRTGPGPGPREGAEMAYDAARGQVILYGGATTGATSGTTTGSGIVGDTWAWDGQAWSQVSATGPAARFPNAMVYDAARQTVLLLGGHYVTDAEFRPYADLWEWDGAAWIERRQGDPNPGYRIVSRLVFDPTTARVLMFGGGGSDAVFLRDMWAWDGAAWAQIAADGAPVRSGFGAAYDAARDVVVLFGGVARPGGGAVTDTWEWDRQTWRCVHGCG